MNPPSESTNVKNPQVGIGESAAKSWIGGSEEDRQQDVHCCAKGRGRPPRLLAGKGLKSSFKQLLDELPQREESKDTLSEIMAQVVWRLTRMGRFAIVAALAPLLIMAVQTWMLSRQNDKLDTQNGLLGRPTSAWINKSISKKATVAVRLFFMSNIMDKLDIELRSNPSRSLSDPLIGRIVSLE